MSGSEMQTFFQSFLTSFMRLVIQCVAYWLTSWPELEYTILILIMQVLFSKKLTSIFGMLIMQYTSQSSQSISSIYK